MRELLYLSREDVERLLDVDAMLDALGKALIAFSAGITIVPRGPTAVSNARTTAGAPPCVEMKGG